MGHIIKTNKGIDFNVPEGSMNLEEFQANMNIRGLIAISIDNIILNKGNIKVVVPSKEPTEEEATHVLGTTDGETYRVVIEDYQAREISNAINNIQTEFVKIGGIVLHKHIFDFLQ